MNQSQEIVPYKTTSVNIRKRCHKNHGLSHLPEYEIWKGIKKRCFNPSEFAAPFYRGKGVTMHKDWIHDPSAFIAYVGARPTPDHSIDRFPNRNGNYEPGNVRWATWKEQNRNKDDLNWIEFRGEKICLSELAEKFGFTSDLIRYRIEILHWEPERAVTTPIKTWVKINYKGQEYSQRALVKAHGVVSFNAFQDRMKKGWGLEIALKTPSLKVRKIS